MSIDNIYSSTPNIILTGIDDQSGRVLTPEEEQYPQHLPWFFTFAPMGDEETNVLSTTSLTTTLGAGVIDYNSAYATHVTPFIKGLASEGNMMMIQRLRPDDARNAWIRFSLEVTPVSDITRNGKSTGVAGYQLRWITSSYAKGIDTRGLNEDSRAAELAQHFFGKGKGLADIGLINEAGETSSVTGITTSGLTTSKVYPIFDLEISHFGAYGNNLGLRIFSVNRQDDSRLDTTLLRNKFIRPFRVQFIKRANRRASPTTVKNIYGTEYIECGFKPNAVDMLGNDFYMGSMLLDQYRDLSRENGHVPKYGPFNNIHVYDANIRHILKTLYETELLEDVKYQEVALNVNGINENGVRADQRRRLISAGTGLNLSSDEAEDSELEAFWQLDIFQGKDIDGYNYRTFKVVGMEKQGEYLTENKEHWAMGGLDGKMNNDIYNELVLRKLEEIRDESSPYNEMARYPYSVFYDTGFPADVKEAMSSFLVARKDVSVCMATHSVPTVADARAEEGIGVRVLDSKTEAGLVSRYTWFLRAIGESEVSGTQAVRGNLILQCGTIIGDNYRGKVPMTYELAMKRARFMGAANGRMRAGYGYDQDGLKQLRYVKEVSSPFVPFTVRERNWTGGATWAQAYDRNTMFFPAVRTIYKDDTSVLLSDINMLIAVDLQKVCFRTWRRLVGDAKLTTKQFIDQSNRIILEQTEGRYDGRVTITPDTFFTKADETRGYSWHCRIHMYANNMRTVGVYTVVAHRQSDLEGGN